MTFKRVNDFSTDPGNEAKLDRELSQLEDNIARSFQEADDKFALQMVVRAFTPLGTDKVVAIQPGDQLSLDTGPGDVAVVFPPLTPANFGRLFRVLKRYPMNNVVLSCQDPTVLLNGAAFVTIAAVGVTTVFCDATGYYK